MLVRFIPADLLWDLHLGLERQLGPEVISCLAEKLEPDLYVDLGDANSVTIILVGMDALGVIRRWQEWSMPSSNKLGTVCALRLRLEGTLSSCRDFDSWVGRALRAIREGGAIPPRLGRKWS